jgi:ribosomal-protein-alanine N-acetyltransferase
VGAGLGRDHLSRKAFTNRVYWAQRAISQGSAVPLFIHLGRVRSCWGRSRWTISGAARRRPARWATGSGSSHARQGYMRETIEAVVHYAFRSLDLSRVEAACLPENAASRGVLEKTGFKYEGVAQSYLQINGRWRNHVLYANLRSDRRGADPA